MQEYSLSTIIDDKRFVDVLKRYGYLSLNGIQLKSFKSIIKGNDTLIMAPTGFGKTEAALFPIFWMLYKGYLDKKGISCLYITPLRALNRDIFRRIEKLGNDLNISIELRHGDTPKYKRRKTVVEPPDILITTPETLQFLLVGKRLRNLLMFVKWVIIDEVHELLESKRGTQLAVALERLEKIAVNKVIRIALSATIGNEEIASRYFNKGRRMDVIRSTDKKEIDIDVLLEYQDVNEHKQLENRLKRIVEIVEMSGNTLIFTNTRDTAELLASRLRLLAPFDIRVHHGSLSRDERINVENEFKKGIIKAVVATSSLELGIDIGLINMVIQYMSPRQVNRLLQRVGRSGHIREKVSRGVILTSSVEEYLESIVIAMRALRGNLDENKPIEEALDVLAHQVVGLLLEYRRIRVDEVYNIIIKAYPYRNLSFSRFYDLIKFMEKIKLLKIYTDKIIGIGPRSYEYYFETSMIPDVDTFIVVESSSQRRIGGIDSDFVMSVLSEGGHFILSGNVWNILKIDIEKRIIYVRKARLSYGILPAWSGEDLPVPYKVAREVCALRRRLFEFIKCSKYKSFLKDYGEIRSFRKTLDELVNYFSKFEEEIEILSERRNLLIELRDNIAIINSCLGSRGNEALGILLVYLFSLIYGDNIAYKTDPYNVILISNSKINKEKINKVLKYITESEDILNYLNMAVKKTNLFKWKFLQVSKRMGLLSKNKSKYILSNIYRFFANTPVEDEALSETIHTRFDIDALNIFISNIRKHRIMIVYKEVKRGDKSLLGEEVFKKYYKTGFLISNLSLPLITKIVEERLFNTKIRLLCLHCGKWSSIIKVRDISIDKCPICGSKALAVYSAWIEDPLPIVKKWKENKGKLTKEERKLIKNLQKSAIVFLNYGKKGIVALAGRGIGPYTALKILRSSRNREELIQNIIKAENNYLRTREYWD